MKKLGITNKLFITTSLVFILFYIIVLVCQLLVFPEFYEHRKMSQLERDADLLALTYKENPSNIRESNSPIMQRLYNDESSFTLTDLEGNMTANAPFGMQVVQPDGRKLNISLSFIISAYRMEFENMKIAVGDEVEMLGEFGAGKESNFFFPYYLQKVKGGAEAGVQDAKDVESTFIKGEVNRISLPNLNKTGRRLGLLYLAMDEFFPLTTSNMEQLKNMRPVELIWQDSLSGSKNGLIIHPVQSKGKPIELLFLVTSLQEIKETNSALRVFYAYLGVGGILIIFLLSIFYSRMVTRPLIMLNKNAEKMKNFDFTGGEMVHRQDELGYLSNTLFQLSSKLDITLEELNQANSQLKKEIEQKEELEQLQKDFFANASHELKTPISIVRGFAEGMSDGINVGKQEHYVNVILEESEKMELLVQDMLDLLRLESNAVVLYKTPVLLSELTEYTLQKLVYQMKEKHIISRISQNEEQEISVDISKIEQVVQNLLTNAIRHAEENSIIDITITGDEEFLTYSVHNKGEGIPEAYLKRIWERFFRAEASRDRKRGGTGLGLAIVKRILELHQCEYKVENKDGGVTFTLTFPIK